MNLERIYMSKFFTEFLGGVFIRQIGVVSAGGGPRWTRCSLPTEPQNFSFFSPPAHPFFDLYMCGGEK